MISQIALALCVLLVAWLTAGAMAVRSASRIWLRHWAERHLHGASSVQMYLERPQRLVMAANALVALALGIAGLAIGWRSVDQQDLAVLGLAGYAGAIILLGQLLPRAIARRWPSALIPLTMPGLRAAEMLTSPLLGLGENRAIAGDVATMTTATPRAVMAELLREGELEGVGKRDEIAIISGVMAFGEKAVADVMTPRADIFAIAEELDARAVATRISESAFSRVPVYRGSLDQIVGMYHAFDVIKEGAEERPRLRSVAVTPATTPCNQLLFRMLRQRMHLAVVQDSNGGTLGVATLEDLLEELVGDIRDEHDEPAPARRSSRISR